MNPTFKETWKAAQEKYNKPTLYNRQEVHKLLGFSKSVLLTTWLKDNDFITTDNYPCNYLLKRGLMECHTRSRNTSNVTDHVPLFTQQGIDFFKILLRDPEELKRVCDEITAERKRHSIPII